MYAKCYDELPEQCKECINLKIYSAYMNGNHSYCCTQYPRPSKMKLEDINVKDICPARLVRM